MLKDGKYRGEERGQDHLGKAQSFLSKIPHAKGVTAHLVQMGAGVIQLPFCLSRTALCDREGC